jgi:large subunit ribosomal protein L23
MILKPITSEKAVKLIDLDNTMIFEAPMKERRDQIKTEVERLFDVKVEKVRTLIRDNKKIAYVKLKKENPAIDLATKLGMM